MVLGDLDLISTLGMAGLRSCLVAPRESPARYSRFVDEFVEADDATDAEMLDLLVDLAGRLPCRPVLFYQSDADLLLVSRHRALLGQFFHFVVPDADLVEDLVDKSRFQALAERTGLPAPRTRVLPVWGGANHRDLDYPLVLKPATRARLTCLSYDGKAVTVRSRDELQRVWETAREQGVELVAQELVPGPEAAVESYHAYVDRAGTVVAEFTGAKVRTRPNRFGYSTAVRTTRAPDVVEAGRGVVERLAFTGVLKADFKRDPRGVLHLLEVNPRFSLWHHVGAAAGVNIPAVVHAELSGAPRACQVGGDRRAAQECGAPASAWLWWLLHTSARAEGRWTDPMPLVRGLLLARFRGTR